MNILVCTVARSGSNWFRDELVLRGYPECSEWYHPTQLTYSGQREYRFKQALLEGKDFGSKLFPEHVQKYGGLNKLSSDLKENSPTVFIRLKREDYEAQALSWAGANIKKSWFESTQKYANNQDKVDQFLGRIIRSNKWWDKQLATREHYFVSYERMKEDSATTIAGVVDYIESKR